MAHDPDRRKAPARVQFPLDADSYNRICEIGVSERSVVYKAICESVNSTVVAVKVIDIDGSKVDVDEFFAMHVNSLSLLEHSNILSPHCSFIVHRQLWVVMPFVHPGPLQVVAASRFYKGFFEQFLAIILRQILTGLAYLHELGHIHKDIKASNIFVDSKGVVKLSDVGVSTSIFDSQSVEDSSVPYWVAPEVTRSDDGYSSKSDIWSFGILALELAYGCPPTSDLRNIKSLLLKISRRFQYSLNVAKLVSDNVVDRNFSADFKNLVTSCLVKDPSERPSVLTLLKHPFIMNSGGPNFLFKNIATDMMGIDERFGESRRRLTSLMKNNNEDNNGSKSSVKDLKIRGWVFNNFIFELEPDEESTGRRVRFGGETIIPSEVHESSKSLMRLLSKREGTSGQGGDQDEEETVEFNKEAMIDFLTTLLLNLDEQREVIAFTVAQMGGHLEREEEMIKEIQKLKAELVAEKERSFQLELDFEILKLRLPGSDDDEQFYRDDSSEEGPVTSEGDSEH